MRVWLIEDADAKPAHASLQPLLETLIQDGKPLLLAGVCGWVADLSERFGSAAPDLVLYNGVGRSEPAEAVSVLETGLPLLVALASVHIGLWSSLAEKYPLAFIPPSAGPEEVWAALQSLIHAHKREAHLRTQVATLNQRLSDRIVIEKAKGVLMQSLGLSEEEAYKRLRVQSRRQRKKVREIAQSILDSRFIWEGDVTKEMEGGMRPVSRNTRPLSSSDPRAVPPQPAEREGA